MYLHERSQAQTYPVLSKESLCSLGKENQPPQPIPIPGRFPDSLTRRKFCSASCTVAVGGASNSADTVLFSSQPRWATCREERATWTPAQELRRAQPLGAAPAPRRKPNPPAASEYSDGASKFGHRIQPDCPESAFAVPHIWDSDGPKSQPASLQPHRSPAVSSLLPA